MKKGIFLFSFLLLNFNSPTAWALTVLKDVSVFDGERVDLKFDRHVKEKQIKTEFFRDIIQISARLCDGSRDDHVHISDVRISDT